jgi:hypothetical protein
VAQLGRNADGESLGPGRVADCYLGLPLAPAGTAEAPEVLVVAPAALLHPTVPQPDGTLLYELVSGHPDRQPRELVFPGDWPASCAPGRVAPGPRSASTRRRPPGRWWPAGGAATCWACGLVG